MSDVVDISFRIDGKRLPVDHAWALSESVLAVLPWMSQCEQSGVHPVRILESGSGWQRPPPDHWMHLSKRTHFTLRIPMHRVEDCSVLSGKVLTVSNCNLLVQKGVVRRLSPLMTLYAHNIAIPSEIGGETEFLEWVISMLRQHKIELTQLLCGRQGRIRTPTGHILTRSLMITDLNPGISILLQERGIGPHRKLGCGFFLPHKAITPVVDFMGSNRIDTQR